MAQHPTRAFVYPVKEHGADIEKLKQMIAEAGCELACPEASPSDYERCVREADVLVVLICPETMNDSIVNQLVLVANRARKRVVGVWAPGIKDGELSPAINKYGDAAITYDRTAVKDAICGGQSIWLTPEGKSRPRPKTPRHKG